VCKFDWLNAFTYSFIIITLKLEEEEKEENKDGVEEKKWGCSERHCIYYFHNRGGGRNRTVL
jgi:hypothetical protein